MIRYEVNLPDSGCKMMGVAETVNDIPWNARITGEMPVTVLERERLEHLVLGID